MTVDITRKVEVTVSLSGFDMGRAFAEMRNDEQAHFFAGIAAVTNEWDKAAGFQWVMVREELDKMPAALAAFKELAEYATDEDQHHD